MADPVRETIVAAYATALALIATANGYEIDLGGRVLRRLTLQPHEVPTACVITEGETADAGRPVRHYTALLTVHVFLFLRRTEDLDTWINRGVADVKKAIESAATLVGGGTTGALSAVNWTHFVRDNPNVIDDESALEYAVQQVTFETQYVTKHDDPYTGRGEG